jgi:hypothetical protein
MALQQCLAKCLPGDGLDDVKRSEYVSLHFSPLNLAQLRERQQWGKQTHTFEVGNKSKGKEFTLRYNWLCQRGLYPSEPDKANQDAFQIIQNIGEEQLQLQRTLLFGVFDGHGEFGDECSEQVRDSIEDEVVRARRKHGGDMQAVFKTAFDRINEAMHLSTVRRVQRREPPFPACACG